MPLPRSARQWQRVDCLFDRDGSPFGAHSHSLRCEFLIDQGLLNKCFRRRNEDMSARDAAGTVIPEDLVDFISWAVAGPQTRV